MGAILTTLVLITVVAALIYVWLTWHFDYWKKRGIKTAKSYPLSGSFPSLFTQKRNTIYDVDDAYRKYKNTENIVGVFSSRIPQLLILDPEYCHRILVNDFSSFHDNEFCLYVSPKEDPIMANNPFVLPGAAWKERRTEVTPGLTPNRVSAIYPVTEKVCENFVEFIKRRMATAPPHGLNTKDLCLSFSTEVVADCVLGISAQSFTDQPLPLVGMMRRVFDQSFGFIFYCTILNFIPAIRNFYTWPMFAKEVANFFYDLMETSINLRRASGLENRTDFLNYMLQLQKKKGIDTKELTSHTMTFLTDGFETTSSVLAHNLLMLARHPDVQQKVREECGTDPLTFEQLSQLPYLDACIHETLRFFPPLLMGRKVVTQPYDFVNKDGTTVRVEPGQVVILPVFSLHRDPDYYDRAEEFHPERFLESNGGTRKYREEGKYMGFGDGPRVCLGMRFALTQVKAAIIAVVRNFDFTVNPKTRKDNQMDDTFFMARLKDGVWLDFKTRS